MRIAHLSDLHVLFLKDVPVVRFLNKRLTGYVNLRYRRHQIHREAYVRALARAIGVAGVDHIVITGDITNLALEAEFEHARDLLRDELSLGPSQISVVPGNHDVYTRGSVAAGRFAHYFADYTSSDLPEYAVDAEGGRFPFVRLRGPVAIVGLSSAVSRLPMVSAGELGQKQLEAFQRLLANPALQGRTPVVLSHHPPHNPVSPLKAFLDGLRDADVFRDTLASSPQGVLLHGHLHRRVRRTILTTSGGQWQCFGATSASLYHVDDARMAGFNLYEIGARGEVTRAEARVFDATNSEITVREIP